MRLAVLVVLTIASLPYLLAALSPHRGLVILDPALPLGGVNHPGFVADMARFPSAENADLGPYRTRSFAGVHFVEWSGWRKDGRYLCVPRWMVLPPAATAPLLLLRHAIVRLRRRLARRSATGLNDPNSSAQSLPARR